MFILYTFKHSMIMLKQLIQIIFQTLLNVEFNIALKFINCNMTILNRTLNVYENHIQSQHFIQKQLIAFEFCDLKRKINKQFQKMKKTMNNRLKTKNKQLKKIE